MRAAYYFLVLAWISALPGTAQFVYPNVSATSVAGAVLATSTGTQTMAGGLNSPSINNVYAVDSYPSSCTIQGVSYTTALDCAFYSHVAAGDGATLHLGSNTYGAPYTTCAGLVEPATGLQISIVGEGSGDNHAPTEIQAVCSIPAVIAHNPIATGVSSPYSLYIKNINIDANNLAGQCAYITAEKVGEIENVHCRNAVSTTAPWFQLGTSTPGSGLASSMYQYGAKDVFIIGYGNSNSSFANVTINQSGGVPAATVNSGGSYVYQNPPVYIWGFGSAGTAAQPCTTMGTATAVMNGSASPYTLSSVTLNGFSGCSGTIYASVPDLPPAPYGFSEQGDTDSTFQDIVVAGVGQTAGIQWAGGSNNIYHEHPYGAMHYLVEENSNNNHFGAELDSPSVFAVDLKGGKSAWYGSEFVWAGSTPYLGANGIYNETASLNWMGNTCAGVTGNSNGFNLVTSSASGPFSHTASTDYGGGYFIAGGTQCDTLAAVNWSSGVAAETIYGDTRIVANVDGTSQSGISIGTGANVANYMGFSSDRAKVGYDGTGAVLQANGGHVNLNISSTWGSGTVAGFGQHGIMYSAEGPAIPSATTIAPSYPVFHVTGTTTIMFITAPTGCTTSGLSCVLTIIPDGVFNLIAGGNIAVATTSVVNKQLTMRYDPSQSLWYPSY